MNNDFNNNGFGSNQNDPNQQPNQNSNTADNGYSPNGTYHAGGYSFDPQSSFYAPPQNEVKEDKEGSSSQVLGIVGLILSIVCCSIVGIVLGIIAMNRAKASRLNLGYESSEAKVGRICGLIALIAGIVLTVGYVIFAVFYFIGLALLMGETLSLIPFLI